MFWPRKKAMTDALKDVAKFAVEKGPWIGRNFCFQQKMVEVRN